MTNQEIYTKVRKHRLQRIHDGVPEHSWEEHLDQLAVSMGFEIEEA